MRPGFDSRLMRFWGAFDCDKFSATRTRTQVGAEHPNQLDKRGFCPRLFIGRAIAITLGCRWRSPSSARAYPVTTDQLSTLPDLRVSSLRRATLIFSTPVQLQRTIPEESP
jgi:hypothetical protein